MIKKWALGVMLITMLAAPMLACGFPLPAGTASLAPSKATCAADEPVDSCNLRRDAYQLMSAINSASVTDLVVALYIDDGVEVLDFNITGEYDYVVAESSAYFGANVDAYLDEASMTDDNETEDLSDTEFKIIDDIGYTYGEDEQVWLKEELDASALLGLSFLLGVGGTTGANLDLFSEPGIFTVTQGDPVQHQGQEMIVQTLSIDLPALLGNQDALLALWDGLSQMDLAQTGFDPASMGDPAEIVPVASMLQPFLEGTEVTTTLWIGADDGYIHYIDEHYELQLDLSATDPNAAPMTMRYNLKGTIANHNAALMVSAPENVVEAEGSFGFDGGLFGN